MKVFDFDHPFFRPIWVRVLVVIVCGGWGVVEALRGAPVWAAVFLAMAVWAGWRFATTDYTDNRDK